MTLKALSISEIMIGLDMRVILKEKQQEKYASKRNLKAAEIMPAQKEASRTVRKNLIVFMEDDNDVNSGLHP